MYQDDCQAMVKVLPELSLENLLPQVLVGCRYDPHIHLDVLVAAHPVDPVLLQGPEHFRLSRQAHVSYLIQKYGTPVGRLEFSCPVLARAGKGVLHMAEKLTLDQFRGDGGAVDLHHGLLRALALLVQPVGDQLFPGPVVTRDQNTRVRRGNLVNDLLDLCDLRALTDHFIALVHLPLEPLVLNDQVLFVERIPDGVEKPVEVGGLGDVVIGPEPHGLDRRFQLPVPGDHDERDLGLELLDLLQDLHPIHLGHLDVAENEIVIRPLYHFEALCSVPGLFHLGVLIFVEDDLG